MTESIANAPALSLEIVLVYGVLAAVVLGFLRSARSPDVVAMTGAAVLVISGVLPVGDLLEVFSNPGPITVGALFVVSGALQRTGVVSRLAAGAEALADLGPLRSRLIVFATVMAISGIVNNTPVVMVLAPVVIALADRLDTVPSKLLIPLSYASVLGGACTIIGTSTNLIVDGVAQEHGLAPFGIFEITAPGIIVGLLGIAYLVVAGPWLLPERWPSFGTEDVRARRDFVTELFVAEESDLAGRTLGETDVFDRDDVQIVDVVRDHAPLEPSSDLVLEPGDRLTIRSNATNVLELRDMVGPSGRELHQRRRDRGALLAGFRPLAHHRTTVMEGIVGPDSRLRGQRVGDLNLRQAFDVRVLAMHRQGRDVMEFEAERLRFGDTLLLESSERHLRELFAKQDLINLSEPAAVSYRHRQAPIALAAVAAVVVLAALDVMPIAGLAVAGAVGVMALRCIEPEEAYRMIDWRILFLIFGMLAIGQAMEATGAAALLIGQLSGPAAVFGPWLMLALVYALASLLTETITNNAVAVLLTPLVIGLAEQMGLDPRAFVVAVMFAASASFATPLGYQTNTIVYGAGNYRFKDFLRIGLPLNVLTGVVAVLIIPYFWPLQG